MKKLPILLLLVSISAPSLIAQSVTSLLQGASQSTGPAAPASTDPLGRDTPSGTVLGFLQVAQAGNYRAAADYLQMSAVRRQSQGPDLASKLKVLMDRAFTGNMRRLSTRPEGSPDSGDLYTQTIGSFASGEADIPVTLVRVPDPSAGKVWLFSSDTLSRVPELYDNLQAHQIETKLPQGLVSKGFLGMPAWQWLALLIAVPVAAALGCAVVRILAVPRRLWLEYTHTPNLQSYSRLSPTHARYCVAIAHSSLTA